MDVKDHMKSPTSGHESHGVHLCHKCGWPFPKPHPSAKHRRAHKRVCGTIEGYKLGDTESDHPHLAVSDDEHLSDDDQLTPSPKIDKETAKEFGSSGQIGIRSCKSEEDMFSDAVTEFSDGWVTPATEECPESVKQVDANVRKVLVHDLNENQLSKDDETAGNVDISQPLRSGTEPAQGLQMVGELSDTEILGSEIYQPEITEPLSDISIKEVGVAGMNGLQFNSSHVILEHLTASENITMTDDQEKQKEWISSGPETDVEGKEKGSEVEILTGTDDIQCRAPSDAPQLEPKVEETEGKSSGPVILESVVPETERITSNFGAEFKLHEVHENTSDSEALGENVEQEKEKEKELTSKLQAAMTEDDLSPQCANGSVISQVESDSAMDVQLAEVRDIKEDRNEDSCLLSVAETLPAIESPELMVGDFKDRKVLKSSFPLDLGAAEVIRSVEDDNKAIVPQMHPSALSGDSAGSLDNSPSDLNALENDQKEGVLTPVVGEVDTSGLSAMTVEDFGSNGLGASPETSGFEKHVNGTNHSLERSQPHFTDENLLQNEDSKTTTLEHSDVIPLVSSAGEATSETANSNVGENADNSGMHKTVCVATENGKIQAGNELSANTTTTSGHAENSAKSENNQHTSSLVGNDSHDLKKAEIGFPDVANETIEVGAERNLVMHSDTTHESVQQLPNSTKLNIDSKDLENVNSTSSSPKCSDKGSAKTSGSETLVLRPSGTPDVVSELDHEEWSVASDNNLENSNSNKAATLPVDSEFSNIIFVGAEDGNTRDAVISGSLLDEGDDKIRKQNLSVSPVDMSVVSSSRTDSLDGNWGSVSVLSTQSDTIAVADADVLSSSDPQPTKKLDDNLVKPHAAAEESHPNKADVFEPPSFMTLVESGVRDDKENAAASEIQTVQKDEQPNSDALQAGWFPSLTNVVNESEGRKKNEEIIAKVTNWSSGKQHSPLKNLLSEAYAETKSKSPNDAKQVPAIADEPASKINTAAVTTMSSNMASEIPGDHAAKRDMEKEWNSPARYPIEIKKEKRKGKPYWVPFVCCSSVHQDA